MTLFVVKPDHVVYGPVGKTLNTTKQTPFPSGSLIETIQPSDVQFQTTSGIISDMSWRVKVTTANGSIVESHINESTLSSSCDIV